MKQREIDYSVLVTRVMATCFIVICHLMSFFQYSALAQLLSVGVPIFYFISGYLYAEKDIGNEKQWLLKRFFKLYIPLLFWLFIVTASRILQGQALLPWYEYFVTLLNLQGVNFIFTFIPDVFNAPWFFTTIMCCYISLIFEKKYENRIKSRVFWSNSWFYILLMGSLLLIPIGINTFNFYGFYLGIIFKKRRIVYKTNTNGFWGIAIIVVMCLIRVSAHYYFDDTLMYRIITPVTQSWIAIGVFLFINYLQYQFTDLFVSIASSRLLTLLNGVSLYVYVCHRWFFDGTILRTFDLRVSFVIRVLIYAMSVIVCATLLKQVCEPIEKRVDKVCGRFLLN